MCAFCSLECHKDHEIFEIGLRGAFQCDCPTKVFPGHCISFNEGEMLENNTSNAYNQNFQALFCTCHKKILTEEEDMMQCALCNDYFHPTCQYIPLDLVVDGLNRKLRSSTLKRSHLLASFAKTASTVGWNS